MAFYKAVVTLFFNIQEIETFRNTGLKIHRELFNLAGKNMDYILCYI